MSIMQSPNDISCIMAPDILKGMDFTQTLTHSLPLKYSFRLTFPFDFCSNFIGQLLKMTMFGAFKI